MRSAPPDATSVASFPEPFVIAPHYRELPGPRSAHAADRARRRSVGGGHVRLRLPRPARQPAHGRRAGRRARRRRPPRVERAVRLHQRHRPACGRERRGGARPDPRARAPDDAREPRSASTPRSSATPAGSSTRPPRPRSSPSPASSWSGSCRSRRSAGRSSRSTRSRTSPCSARRWRR